jgi:nicotinate-nucleotide adenylyltransferase
MSKITLGIFGGSFDPPHIGHIRLCSEFSKVVDSKIYVMPAKVSPFKQQKSFGATDKDRLEMCKLAFSSIKGVEISDYELKKEEVSYTYKTVEHFLSINPNEKICLCVGADCLESLECWANAEYLFKNCSFVAAYRYEDGNRSFGEAMQRLKIKYNADIISLGYDPISASSTEIREAISEGRNIEGLLSDEVALYIKEKGLYGG